MSDFLSTGLVFALFGVAVSISLGAAGSAKGIGVCASSAAGLLSKQPKVFGQALLLSAMPSTQVLYGLLFGFIILIQTKMLGGEPVSINYEQGLMLFASSFPVGFACLFSGIWQGKVAQAGMKILAEKPENSSQAIVLAALVETIAIFGFVISLLIAFIGIKLDQAPNNFLELMKSMAPHI